MKVTTFRHEHDKWDDYEIRFWFYYELARILEDKPALGLVDTGSNMIDFIKGLTWSGLENDTFTHG